jgi:hypothetical protein
LAAQKGNENQKKKNNHKVLAKFDDPNGSADQFARTAVQTANFRTGHRRVATSFAITDGSWSADVDGAAVTDSGFP